MSLLDRATSVFRRRNSERKPPPEGTPFVGPNGIVMQNPPNQHPHSPTHAPPPAHQPPHQHPGHQHPHPHPKPHPHPSQPPHHGGGSPFGGDGPLPTTSATSSGQLEIELQNDTDSSDVFAYITGQAIDSNNALYLLSSDGRTSVFPNSPSSTGSRIAENISIPLGRPGNSVRCTIPRLAGGRIWFSVGAPLVFAVNPGPGLVEPSIFNQADPNVNTNFGFAEFTFNNAQVFANITYVDFVGTPIALTLEDTSGHIQHVSGIPSNGLQTIASGLRAQTARDGVNWSSLIVNGKSGSLLRILSPNSAVLLNPSLFSTYWNNYTNQVFGKYISSFLQIDTQAGWGNVQARVSNGAFEFGSGGAFGKPSARDIFSCSTGPFATGGNAETNVIIPRLSAAFNRSTLLLTDNQPDGVGPGQYYQNATTNHYARIVHAANLDGHGYAFPYDDVTPDGGVPQEGAVFSYSPALLTVTVGGRHAHV